MRFRHRKQGRKPNCGPVAVAVLADLPVEFVDLLSESLGTKPNVGTRVADTIKILRALGFKCPTDPVFDEQLNEFPEYAFAIVGRSNAKLSKNFHYVAVVKGRIFDGSMNCLWPRGWRFLWWWPLK